MELTRMIGALIISLQRSTGRRRDDMETDANSGDEADDALDAIDTNF